MAEQGNKKNIMQKVAQVAGFTALSKALGILREMLQSNFLGVGLISDAFITAFKIPNFFRHIFAEGALSAAFVPQFVTLIREKKDKEAASFMTITLLFFSSFLLCLSVFVFWYAPLVTKILATGFSEEQLRVTVPYVQLLFPLIFFYSATALLSGALQSVNHFFIPAFGQPVINVIYIGTLLLCIAHDFSGYVLCGGILLAAALQFVMNLVAYFAIGLRFGSVTKAAIKEFRSLLVRFFFCLSGISVNEINLLIDLQFSSYLAPGSVSLVYYAMRFIQIPLGIVGVALATVLFPHFSRVALYAKSRLSFYLLESTKLLVWLVTPMLLYLMFVSEKIFSILMLKKATPADIQMARWILIVLSLGLVFYCLNRILVSLFYALKDTKTPAFSTMIQAFVKLGGDRFAISSWGWGISGIAIATVVSSLVLTSLHFIQLYRVHHFIFYTRAYADFFKRFALQLLFGCALYYSSYRLFYWSIEKTTYYNFFAYSYGYFLYTLALFAGTMMILFLTQRLFGLKLYFLRFKK